MAYTIAADLRSGLGGPLVNELIKQFGPMVIQVILELLQRKLLTERPPVGAFPGSDTFRHFIAELLRRYKDEIKTLVMAAWDRLYETAVDSFEAQDEPIV